MTGWVRTRRPRGEDGQMAVAFIIFTAMLVLAFFVVALVPVGASTNERSRAQTAADAAALAGAEQARTTWVYTTTFPGLLSFLLGPVPPVTTLTGSAGANTYAAQNKATVLDYRMNPSQGTTYARVQHNTAAYPEHGRAEAEATAEMDIDFSDCRWDNPAPEPPPPPAGTGPPFFNRTLTCGAWSASYVVANVPGVYMTTTYVGDTALGLYDDLEPRLVK